MQIKRSPTHTQGGAKNICKIHTPISCRDTPRVHYYICTCIHVNLCFRQRFSRGGSRSRFWKTIYGIEVKTFERCIFCPALLVSSWSTFCQLPLLLAEELMLVQSFGLGGSHGVQSKGNFSFAISCSPRVSQRERDSLKGLALPKG